jgi:hypothetical protein
MAQPRRFGETRLGQALPSVDLPPAAAGMAVDSLIGGFVARWAGVESGVQAVRLTGQAQAAPGVPLQLSGRVYARHLDGSRCIEVEVAGHAPAGLCLGGMVRVALA